VRHKTRVTFTRPIVSKSGDLGQRGEHVTNLVGPAALLSARALEL
jgi:hypothetical protein